MSYKNYRNDFDNLVKKGIDYFEAKKILYDYDSHKKYCGKCGTEIISKKDYIIEETNYVCFVWYQCSNCQEINELVA